MKRKIYLFHSGNHGVRNIFYKQIFNRLGISLFVLLLCFCTCIYVYINKQKDWILEDCENNVQALGEIYKNECQEIYNMTGLLTHSQEFEDVFFASQTVGPEENFKYNRARDIMARIVDSRSVVESMYFLDKDRGTVIGSFGTITLEYFYHNKNYGTIVNQKDYLVNYPVSEDILQFLPEDTLGGFDEITVQPVLINKLFNYECPHPLVVNINTEKMEQLLFYHKLTPNTRYSILSKDTGKILFTNRREETKGRKYRRECGVTVYGTEFLMAVEIPAGDLFYALLFYYLLGVITLLTCGGIAFFLVYYNTKKIYEPVQELLSIMPDEMDTDEFLYLKREISHILEDNKRWKNDFQTIFPEICEKFIIDILENKTNQIEQLREIMQKNHFVFRHPFFSTALIGFYYYPAFTRIYDEEERRLIQKQLPEVIKAFLHLSQDSYLLPYGNQKYCIIANTESRSDQALYEKIKDMQKLFQVDKETVMIAAGIGRAYEALENIHLSWREAVCSFETVTPYSLDKVRFFNPSVSGKLFQLTEAECNHITNYLLSGNYNLLNQVMCNISERMAEDDHMTELQRKDTYTYLHNLGRKVLLQMKLTEEVLMGEGYICLDDMMIILSSTELFIYLDDFYQAICEWKESKRDLSLFELKEYIDAHYLEPLYLEGLAEMYQVTPQYVSKELKKALGMPFKQYINRLRVEKAKHLLLKTDMKIEDIAMEAGFNNRVSFVRVFKMAEGIAPSEYRHNHEK